MFSASAENGAIPGLLRAASRSRWTNRLVLAICSDQSAASRARSPFQESGARPLALRSALTRVNRSLAIAAAVLDGRTGSWGAGAGGGVPRGWWGGGGGLGGVVRAGWGGSAGTTGGWAMGRRRSGPPAWRPTLV